VKQVERVYIQVYSLQIERYVLWYFGEFLQV
jgi:hypothetical protein